MTDIPLGSSIEDGRVRFRVWAPNADQVSVALANGESNGEFPLERNEDGTWSGALDGGPGLEYVFTVTRGEETFDRIDPRARMVTNSVGRAVVLDPSFDWNGDAFATPPVDELVIYELHTGTFGGDLDGVASRLDHIAAGGFTAIELMPVGEFAGDVSWGYNPALPYAVESAYGGPEALKRLVRSAHERGIAVILDVVYNHFGPSDLDMWRFDGWYEADGGGVYFYNDHRSVTPWGHTRPDYGRPEVRDFIVDNARMWFGEYHIDGLRLDSTINMRTVGGAEGTEELPDGWLVMQQISEMRDGEFPGRLLIAEDLQGNEWLTKTVGEGGAGFDLQWSAGFVHPVRSLLEAADDQNRDMTALVTAIAGPDHRDGWGRVVYTESHDEVANGQTRVVSEIDGEDPDAWYARGRAMCGIVSALTARGVPMMFQGQEWLESDYFRDDAPVDWSGADNDDADTILRLVRLRSGRDSGAVGLRGSGFELAELDEGGKVVAYRRWREGGPGDEALVVMNLSVEHRAVKIQPSTGGRWAPAVSTDPDSRVSIGDDGWLAADLAGYSAVVALLE